MATTRHSEQRTWTLDSRSDGVTHISVKRCCENCGAPVGDVSEIELAGAIAGIPMGSVAHECDCAQVVEQLAMLNQRADAFDNGKWPDGELHPTWAEIGEPGQESYRKEALRTLRAVVHLGWGPLNRVLKQIGMTE